ncbi:MAG: pyridoxal phosphate-dependent aminotransferase [Lactobacillales bacterium]|jgi:aspartate/methionine/tyrosine aminotransferase|nr:pyridoxal phosphate-dependent aminotransferase [Lactobacillales bacterium]
MENSQRIKQLQPSITLAAADQAKALQAAGKDVLMLTLGEPDFVTPRNITMAAKRALDSGKTSFYTAAKGMPELLEAIILHLQKFYDVKYQTNQVVATTGAKFALYALFQTILNAWDEVLIPKPFWVSYVEQVQLAQGRAVFVETFEENHFKVSVDELEKRRTSKAKAVVLNSPANPTGIVYSADELRDIGEWAVENDLLIVSDDIYGRLVYNGCKFTPIVSLSEEIANHTVVINGLSKTYAMTGWRMGYAAGPTEIIAGMVKIVGQATSNLTTVTQYAAIEALVGDQSSVEAMCVEFERRLNELYPKVAAIPGFKLDKPQGSFYLFPNVKKAMERCGFADVTEFTGAILKETGVALVTGAGFGAPYHLRLSYATKQEIVEEAIRRVTKFVKGYSQK